MPGRPVIRARRGVQKPEDTQPEAVEGLLEQVKRVEAELAGVRESDPNAKWKIARLRSKQTFLDSNDTEYWCCLCFQSREQKEAFLRAVKLLDLGDKYLWGPDVAKRWKVALPDDRRAFHKMPVSDRWTRFAMDTDEGGIPAAPTKRQPAAKGGE